jgi:hypothetical protein
MAHSLPGARCILALRSTREKNGAVTSNILWNYGHETIPRHLRDVAVTEYGIADLRGRTDQEVIAALLNIADSRFQDSLKHAAQAAGNLSKHHQIPELHRNNTPRALQERFAIARARGWPKLQAVAGAALSRGTPGNLRPCLERMSLWKPRTRQEWLWQRLLVRELRALI